MRSTSQIIPHKRISHAYYRDTPFQALPLNTQSAAMGDLLERSSHASRRALQSTSSTMPAQIPGRPQPWALTKRKNSSETAADATVRPPTHVIWLAPNTVPSSASAHGANGCMPKRSPHQQTYKDLQCLHTGLKFQSKRTRLQQKGWVQGHQQLHCECKTAATSGLKLS